MPSRAYTSFLLTVELSCLGRKRKPVSMPSRAYTSFLPIRRGLQYRKGNQGVNALSGLYLISTYPFKNLGFMRFPETVFAGIYQNTLTTAVFRAC